MRTRQALLETLDRIDGRGYKAYRDIEGPTRIGDSTVLRVDRVQADPFAAPSKVRVHTRRPVPSEWFETRLRQVAVEDWFLRRLVHDLDHRGYRGLQIDVPGQEVLERTAVRLKADGIEARIYVSLPARGRTILGRAAGHLLNQAATWVERAAQTSDPELAELYAFIHSMENQDHLRRQLEPRGLVAFVADGARLARESGVSDRPLSDGQAIEAPSSCRVELPLLHPPGASVTGLGLPEGVTLVVGGGYHGKSTLLEALQRGIYQHVPGDGRELVVTRPDAVKLRAEDGRRVEAVDISNFIEHLPGNRSTAPFHSEDASGSTSQAAALIEALEADASVFLMDEDTSATNFMIRDARMQALVAKEDEPITPFVDRVRELWERFGRSTILVMGGSGDYFGHADRVLQMKDFQPADVTAKARQLAGGSTRKNEAPPMTLPRARHPKPEGLEPSRGRKAMKIDAPRPDELRYGEQTIDMRAVEQRVDRPQLRAVGACIERARSFMDGRSMAAVLRALQDWLDQAGVDGLGPEGHPGSLCRPRIQEVAAALNRHRGLRCESRSVEGLGRGPKPGNQIL